MFSAKGPLYKELYSTETQDFVTMTVDLWYQDIRGVGGGIWSTRNFGPPEISLVGISLWLTVDHIGLFDALVLPSVSVHSGQQLHLPIRRA
jgi:hypothetical protein